MTATDAGGRRSDSAPDSSAAATDTTADSTADTEPLWRNRSFRRFFLGQFVTNAGDSLYAVAIVWLIFELSGSTVLTGLANALLLLPYLLQIVAGPVVDRLSLKRVMVGTQIVQGLVVLAVPLAAFTDRLSVTLLVAIIPILSLVSLLFSPVQATVVPRIVPRDQLSRGNSALATVSLGLDMIFDALGGLFVAVFGATALFLLDSVTFALAGLLFASMTIPTVGPGATDESDDSTESDDSLRSILETYATDLREGIAVLRGTLFVELVLVAAVFNFATGVTLGILPAFADRLGDAAVYGSLLAALGVGRLIGSALAPSLHDVPYGSLKAVASLVSAVLWIGSVVLPSVPATVVLFGLAWVTAGADAVVTTTLNQRAFAPDLLGRISSIKGTAATATLPLGSLLGGFVAESIGVETTMLLAAGGFAFAGLYVAARRPLRQLPAVDGIDPAVLGVSPEATPNPGDSDGSE